MRCLIQFLCQHEVKYTNEGNLITNFEKKSHSSLIHGLSHFPRNNSVIIFMVHSPHISRFRQNVDAFVDHNQYVP